MGRPLVIVRNPAAGRGKAVKKWPAVAKLLGEAGFEWCLRDTSAPGHAREIALAAAKSSPEGWVVAAGGDGTASEVADALQGTDAIMGVLPLGTGNDLARHLGFGPSLSGAVDALANGETGRVDLIQWECAGRSGTGINVAGLGFDAVVAERINQGFRGLSGTSAYVAGVVSCLSTYRPSFVTFKCAEAEMETSVMLCAVGNASCYGGGMKVAPQASLTDGLFEIVIVEGLPVLQFLLAFPTVFRGTHIAHPRVRTFRTAELTLSSDPPLPVLVDGEIVGYGEVRFVLKPRALNLRVPCLKSI